MADLKFFLYDVPSKVGQWLAIFEGNRLVFLQSYNIGKSVVERDARAFLKKHYHFDAGKIQTRRWSQGDFWKKKHKISLLGTDFQIKVWKELSHIPFGATVSYSEVAEKMGQPKSVRAVATAIATNPICVLIPCHRVLRKSGDIFKYRGGPQTKRQLLEAEGALENGRLTASKAQRRPLQKISKRSKA